MLPKSKFERWLGKEIVKDINSIVVDTDALIANVMLNDKLPIRVSFDSEEQMMEALKQFKDA